MSPKERQEMARNPGKTAAWIEQHIRLVSDDINHYADPLTPSAVLSLACADRRSRDIFAVALCRSLGIPSRLEPGSLTPQYYQNAVWHHLWPMRRIDHPAKLQLKLGKQEMLVPRYATHFTLAQWQNDHFETLEYLFDTPVDQLPVLELPPGSYRLITGIRLFNDDILTKQRFFTLQADQEMTLPVIMGDKRNDASSRITIPPTLAFEEIPSGLRRSLSDTLSPSGAIVCFIRPGHEPSRHLLDDLARIRPALESWGGRIILVLKERREADALADEGLINLPSNRTAVRIPSDQTQFTPRFSYPCCILLDQNGKTLFSVTGYRVGTDSSLLQALQNQTTSAACSPKQE